MKEKTQNFEWKKVIFPLFLALAAFVCFVILYWMGTVNSLNPMYVQGLPFAVPFIIFLIITHAAGKGQFSELFTCVTCIVLVPVLVFSSFFYLFSLSLSSNPSTVTDPSRYERTITRFVDKNKEWLAVFPDKIPKNAKDVSFYYSVSYWLDYSETAVLKFSVDSKTLDTYEKKLSSVLIPSQTLKDDLRRALYLIGEQHEKSDNYTTYKVYEADYLNICMVFINRMQGTIIFFTNESRD